MITKRIFVSTLLTVGLLSGSAAAQAPQGCDGELRQLRYLVQLYQAGRTSTEFALAQAEAGRQAAEMRVKALEEAIKHLPAGQK